MPLNLTEDKNVYGVIRIVILATDDLNKVVSLLQLFLHIYSFSHLFIALRCLSFTEDNTKTIWCFSWFTGQYEMDTCTTICTNILVVFQQ